MLTPDSITESSPNVDAMARKNETILLRCLASVGQSRVAAQLDVNESTISRWKEAEIARTAKFLAVIGLKAVPMSNKCFNPKDIEAVLHLARQRMTQLKNADSLEWEDDE